MNEESKGEVVIYESEDGETRLDVSLKQDTVWLSQLQMAELFGKDKRTISWHINNVFKERELKKDRTVQEYWTVQNEGGRKVKRKIEHYSLDVIISVGYRIKSHMGTRFRIWATQILKDHLVRGYSLNERRLREQNLKFAELKKAVSLLGRIIEGRQLGGNEATGLLKVIADYSHALTLLDEYDHHRLEIRNTRGKDKFILTYKEAHRTIDRLNQQYRKQGLVVGLFGIEKDQSFQGLLGGLYQTFDGKELYPSIEEKAAHLLYFVIKDHPFVDGNKRIGASLFIWFLDANGILYAQDGSKRIGDNALVALSLLIAESKSEEKEIIIKVIVNLINRDN